MFDKQQDSGVSPVIGVILMVAVTVALVALVTVTVFDLGGDVSESPDATVQLEEDGGAVTATVLRNENVQDFTLQLETASSGTQTQNLGGDAGATNTASPISTTQTTETFSSPVNDGDTVTVTSGNTPVTSIDEVLHDSDNDGSPFDGDDTDVTGQFSIDDAGAGDLLYTSSSSPADLTSTTGDAIQVQYTYEDGSSVTFEKATVIANMPDGNSEVLTSTEINN